MSMYETESPAEIQERKLVALFGMPRSGTTWLGKIFDSHPGTLYRHEPDSWGRLNEIPLAPDLAEAGAYRELLVDFVHEMESMTTTKVAGTLPAFPKEYYSAWRFHLRRLWIAGAKVFAKAFGEIHVPPFVDYARYPDIVVVWKSIESTARLGVVSRALPQASIIHLIRHPCGYVASVLRGEASGKFTAMDPSSEDFGIFEAFLGTSQAQSHGLTKKVLIEMHPIQRMAWRWVLFNEKAMADMKAQNNSMTLRYEDLCEAPLQWVKEVFEFSGLSWSPQTEAFLENSTSGNNDGYYSVRKDPRRASIRWHQQLSRQDVKMIEDVVSETRPGKLYY